MKDIYNYDDVIDSRDVIARIEELEEERQAISDNLVDSEDTTELELWDNDNADELKSLKELNKEGENATSDWTFGATLIHESYFTRYCQELCDDVGDLPKDLPAYIVIDWDATAENLKVDYTTVEFDGQTYYVR